jgi:succinyl-CoA synthetase beta subunit
VGTAKAGAGAAAAGVGPASAGEGAAKAGEDGAKAGVGTAKAGDGAKAGAAGANAGARQVKALDAKVTLDDNALFRHPENAQLRDVSAEDPQERMAKERGLTYVKLDGDIGILGNGAGLVMSTLDVVAQAGGSPANFLDAGGGAKAEAITSAVEVILSNPKVKAVLFNIFGGITRGEEVANGLIEAFAQIKPQVPFVVRLDGTNSEEGRRMLQEANLPNVVSETTMDGAAQRVVELARAA